MGKTTGRKELVEDVARKSGFTKIDCRAVLEAALKTISDSLVDGQSIEIRGFGTFYAKFRKARPARNPRTGVVVMLPKRWVALFTLSSDIKSQIKDAHAAKEKNGSHQ